MRSDKRNTLNAQKETNILMEILFNKRCIMRTVRRDKRIHYHYRPPNENLLFGFEIFIGRMSDGSVLLALRQSTSLNKATFGAMLCVHAFQSASTQMSYIINHTRLHILSITLQRVENSEDSYFNGSEWITANTLFSRERLIYQGNADVKVTHRTRT